MSVHAQIPIAAFVRLRRSVRRARVRGLARLRPDRRLRLGQQRCAGRHQSDRADDVQYAHLDHQPTHRDWAARDLAGERPIRKRDRAAAARLYPERQLRQGAVDAQSQIVDGALTSNARFQRDIRNAGIRDEHTTSSLHCAALDSGQTVTVSGGQSWKVTQSIQDVADTRGEAGPNQPAFYGQSQAIAAIAQLHFARYCAPPEATAGLCSLSSTPNADQRASTLFGTGTLSGQAGVTAANDYVTNLVQPIVPAALRGDQLTSEVGRDASIRRHAYNARISLARQVLDYAVGIQSPSVPLNSAQQTQMQNEGLTPVGTGSWLQVLMLDANRRYSDVNYAAQLQAMPPASVNREIALELASTNYLLTQLLRVGIMHASTAAAHMAADVEHDFQPTAPLSTPNIN